MKQANLEVFLFMLFLSVILSVMGCSSDDNPTDPNDPDDAPGTVQLLTVDFESTLSGWHGAPIAKDSSHHWDWDRRYSSSPTTEYHVTGTSTVTDITTIGISSSYSHSGSKSLLFTYQYGISSTLDAHGYYYSVDHCISSGENVWAYPLRKVSLLDYATGDSAFVSLMIKPIQCDISKLGGSIDFRVIVEGAHGVINDIRLDSTYLLSNLGNWNEIIVDLTPYTGWENDVGIKLVMDPVGAQYCWQFRRGVDWMSDIHNPGDSTKCMLAIDDVKMCIIPSSGKEARADSAQTPVILTP